MSLRLETVYVYIEGPIVKLIHTWTIYVVRAIVDIPN